MDRIYRWGADFEGSTRAVGLLRICLALIIWVRFAQHMRLIDANALWQAGLTVAFFTATAMMLIGWRSQIACALTATILFFFYYWWGHTAPEPIPSWSGHHVYILFAGTALLSLTPCGRSYSLDRWLAIRRAEAQGQPMPEERGRLWGQRLIVIQMAALYFWTAIDKTGAHFLSGDRLEAIMIWGYTGRALEAVMTFAPVAAPAAILVTLIEYFLPVGIIVRRLHPVAIPVGLALHAAFYVMLTVNTYSITMMALYLAVVDPDSLHRFLDRMQGAGARRAPGQATR